MIQGLCPKRRFSLYLSLSIFFMHRYLFFIFLFFLIFVESCGDKTHEKSQTFESPAGDISISVISTRHYDAGITGTPHAPIIIPYINREIFNGVEISLKGSDKLIVDDLSEYSDLLSKDQINAILEKISVTSSPDGKNIAYRREKTKGDTILIVHRFDDGTLFYSGIYETQYRKFISANSSKDFDWKSIPSANEIAKEMLLDTISNEVRDVIFENALLNQKHPSELDNFSLENFGGSNLATTYIQVLSTDSFWKIPNADWDKKVHARIDFLNSIIEKTGKDFDGSLIVRPIFENLMTLERQANSISIANQIDSMLCRMSFVSDYVNDELLDRMGSSIVSAPSNAIYGYYHDLGMEKINAAQTKFTSVLRTAENLGDSTLELACGKKLLPSWPEMASDSLNENTLATYYDDFPSEFQNKIRAKAEKYIDTKYFDEVKDILLRYSTCEQLLALRKKHPAKFEGEKMPCDSTIIYSN